MKTKIVSFWTLANGACFSYNGKPYSKTNKKEATSNENNVVVAFKEEDQVEVVNSYKF